MTVNLRRAPAHHAVTTIGDARWVAHRTIVSSRFPDVSREAMGARERGAESRFTYPKGLQRIGRLASSKSVCEKGLE